MKKPINTKWVFPLLFFCLATIIGITISCENENTIQNPEETQNIEELQQYSSIKSGTYSCDCGIITDYCGEPYVADLVYKSFKYGTVTIYNNETCLFVKFSVTGNHKIAKLNLYVGDLDDMPSRRCSIRCNNRFNPKNNNNCCKVPAYNKFPIREKFNPEKNDITYQFCLDELDECFIIAANLFIYPVYEDICYPNEFDYDCNDLSYKDKNKRTNKKSRRRFNWKKPSTVFVHIQNPETNNCNNHYEYIEYCVQECNGNGNGNGNGGSNGNCVFPSADSTLYAGQTIDIGHITMTNDSNYLYVTYVTEGDWYFGYTQLYVGPQETVPRNPSDIPQPGQFPYKTDHAPNDLPSEYIQSFTYKISLEGLEPCYVIVAHAETFKVVDGIEVEEQTAWSEGRSFKSIWGITRWGWVTDYCTQECVEEEP